MRHRWRTLKNSNINNSRCFNNIDYSKPRRTFSDDVLHRWRTLLVTKNSARRASIGSLKSATLAGATYSALLATIRIRPSL
ncbi:hypothetical protein J6590_017249 [Homalodisca vitripennis]|nr:hypothetical protein J6590_017249 [Homalodisca vitripennis]